jgi:hypothetical protein
MTKRTFSVLLLFLLMLNVAASGQEKTVMPEISVNGIRLGNRASAKAFLEKYAPTTDETGRPVYYFYNDPGTQVLKLTAESFEDPFYLVEIEVYGVGENYQRAHFYLKDTNFFITESKIFIGYRQSVASMIIGIPNVSRGDMIGPKDLTKRKGEPSEVTKDGEKEVLTYNFPNFELADENGVKRSFNYTATYQFIRRKLRKFSFKISPIKKV